MPVWCNMQARFTSRLVRCLESNSLPTTKHFPVGCRPEIAPAQTLASYFLDDPVQLIISTRKKQETSLAGILEAALAPVRKTLETQGFLAGATPACADYLVFGAFQWARLGCARSIVRDGDDILSDWLTQMSGLYDTVWRICFQVIRQN